MTSFALERAKRLRVNGRLLSALMMGSALSLGSLAAMLPVSQAVAQMARTHSFDIPGQPLARALRALADQSGLQIAYSTAVASGIQAPAVAGTMTTEQALSRLLAGSGLGYSFSGANTVTITDRVASGFEAPVDAAGAVVLDTIDVTGRGGSAQPGEPFTPDTPYETAGSVSHISTEQMSRVPPTSAGDVFLNTPGVISSGNHVTPSINPNIRGMQSMGRVVTTVDGARQTVSSYRGYIGNRDETYIDPDMIGGVDVTKGPGGGGIGGAVTFRTLNASDILKEGDSFGVRIKGGLGNNSLRLTDRPDTLNPLPPVEDRRGRPDFFGMDGWSGSVAGAVSHGGLEVVAAHSRRQQGNYFSGSRMPDNIVVWSGTGSSIGTNARFGPGAEIYNTSQDVTSTLLKGKYDSGTGHVIELGWLNYHNIHGETNELLGGTLNRWGPAYLLETKVDTYTGRYRFDPLDNDLVDFRANLWHTNVEKGVAEHPNIAGSGEPTTSVVTWGGDVSNTSRFDTALGALSVRLGADYVHEDYWAADAFLENAHYTYYMNPAGVRSMAGASADATLAPVDWLDLSAGLRYDWFESEGEGFSARFVDKGGSRLSPSFSATLKPYDGLQLFAQYKEGYRAPTLRESHWQYSPLGHNPDLRGEIARNVEIGANFLRDDLFVGGDALRLKASWFNNRYDDYIVRMQPGRMPADQRCVGQYCWANIDSGTYRGFEISGSYDAGSWFIEGAYTRYSSIEYCYANNECVTIAHNTGLQNDYASNYIPPKYNGSVTGGIRLFDRTLTLGARAHFAGVRFGGRAPTAGVISDSQWYPAYVVYDAFANWKIGEDTELNFSVENLTDEYYYGALVTTMVPSPGRTFRASFTTKLGQSDFGPGFWNNAGAWNLGAGNGGWSGFYLGAHGIGTALDSDVRMASLTAPDDPLGEDTGFKLKGPGIGVHGGYDHRFANGLVLGIAGDLAGLGRMHETRYETTETAPRLNAGELDSIVKTEFDWLATLRGRVGYAFNDRLMVYGTAGAAFMGANYERTQYMLPAINDRETVPSFSERLSATRTGYTVGAGAEYALGGGWSLNGEVLFTRFGRKKVEFADARAGVRPDTTETVVIAPGVPGYWDFDAPGCAVPAFPFPPECLVPAVPPVTETHDIPGSYNQSVGRQLLDAISVPTVKVGVTYRF